ncbi:glycosyltransferase family 2 protein [Pseudomonas shirazensis]|uniref:Glycosyltransferase family 2 protein n=1 Tax=Pseudomonas shirazensis TaxID=2745494 RepID=A0ABU9A5S6_9PSED
MLTVVIPSYNHEDYVLESLRAALSIDIAGCKILVIDDGSTDNTVGKVNDYLQQHDADARVTVISKANGGLVSSLNLALQMIQTEFFWMVASDDVLIPEGVQALHQRINKNPKLGFIMGGGQYFYGDGRRSPVYRKQHQAFFNLTPEQRGQRIFTNYPSPLLLQSTIFRTESIRAIGGWDPTLKWDDYPILVKLLQRHSTNGVDFDFVPEINCVAYRQHDDNSYKNVYGQFAMVHQALQALAPPALRTLAIGNALAFYALVALKTRNVLFFKRAYQTCSLPVLLRAAFSLPVVASKYLLTKL